MTQEELKQLTNKQLLELWRTTEAAVHKNNKKYEALQKQAEYRLTRTKFNRSDLRKIIRDRQRNVDQLDGLRKLLADISYESNVRTMKMSKWWTSNTKDKAHENQTEQKNDRTSRTTC